MTMTPELIRRRLLKARQQAVAEIAAQINAWPPPNARELLAVLTEEHDAISADLRRLQNDRDAVSVD